MQPDYQSSAQQLQSMGRNGDSMLVHMTPGEVGGLQNLAMSMGGSLSLNPDTGLPEASFLKNILPTLLGVGLAATGVGAPLAAGIIGLGQTALTGDINKGLMAGLGAFGGASLAGGLGIGAKLAGGNAFGLLGNKAGMLGANMGAGAANVLPAITNAPLAGTTIGGAKVAGMGNMLPGFSLDPLTVASTGATPAALNAAAGTAAKTGLAGFAQKFGDTAKQGLGTGMLAKAAPMMAGMGLVNALGAAQTPGAMPEEENKWNYQGPYLPQPRRVRFQSPEEFRRTGGAEFSYFEDANPFPGYIPTGMAEGGLAALPAAGDMQASFDFFNTSPGAITASMRPVDMPLPTPTNVSGGEKKFTFDSGGPPPMYPSGGSGGMDGMGGMGGMGGTEFGGMSFGESGLRDILRRINDDSYTLPFAKGGEVDMKNGSFVVDARTVSELGNGSSNAGIERLAAMGGHPVRGDGDGVSDSVPARIGGRQEARVARDEVIFSPEAVTKLGGGSHSKGVKKLYALMDKAHSARKRAKRGQDTKVAKGLRALA